MKRIFRVSLGLSLLVSLLTPVNAIAISSNPSAVCSGATCTVTFPYTGDFYLWSAPFTGTFTLQVWGAQGGNAAYGASITTYGGKGGYATGTKTLTSGQSLYIYVGGQGDGGGTATQNKLNGGYNGGGFGYNGENSYNRGGGGGGGTDIRITSDTLSNRILVAGGGGGATYYPTYGPSFPGVGGGTSGGNGAVTNYNSPQHQGQGGTQSGGGAGGNNGSNGTAGSLGLGGNAGHAYGFSEGGGGGGYYGGGASGTGMGSGGGSGYVDGVLSSTLTAGNATMPNPSGGTMTGNSGNGVARITYVNNVSPTSFSSATTSPTNTSSAITFSIVLSQNASGIADSDFANTGTATGCVFAINSSSGSNLTLTVTSCSEGTLIPKLLANSIFGTVTSTNGPFSDALTTTPIRIDRTAPTISSVTAPANGTYKPSDTPTFLVGFSESVTITGIPRLTLTVGSATEYASYQSMSDSKTALFRYTVASDPVEFDSDGITLATSLDLNSGTIRDLATNTLTNTSLTAPTLTSVLVAQPPAAPTIDSVTATSGTLTVYFTPGATRGSAITNYTYATNGTTFKTRTDGTTASPLVITTVSTGATNLANGTGYQIRLRAVSAAGTSDSSTVVNETPTAVSVTGDSTLTLTYGNSDSTSTYSATGGTGTYTWSLGSTLTGITLSGTTVTASPSTPAGTYSQTVRATDGNSQVGTRSLTITVNKASTSITIALPNSATNAALGGAVTITATVPRAGAVNFRLGGSTISGCGSAAAATTTATCSWTPNALGSVSFTAIFTPTDTSNFETSTSTTLSITVVNGVSTVTLSLAGGTTTPPKGQAINIIAAVDQDGRITFFVDGKKVPRCINRAATAGNVSCSWKPAVQKAVTISARLTPSNNVYNASSSSLNVQVVRRSGAR